MHKHFKYLFSLWPLVVFVTSVYGQKAPKGFTIPEGTLSPDKHYGVTVPVLAEHGDNDDPKNSLVDLKTGRVVAAIQANTGWDRMNRGGVLPARWSPDSTILLWEVEGRFSPDALVLLKVADNQFAWQVDVLTTVQQAILIRTHQAAPVKYAAGKKWNNGSGSAYPDGFTVNVRAEGDKERGKPEENVKGKPVSLPLRVHAELTSNPKGIEECPKDAQLDSELDGVIDREGKLTVHQFHLRKKPFFSATATSWLELTNPAAAAHAPIEYGDVVSLKGKATRRDEAGKPMYFLALERKISVPASADDPAEKNVAEVRLLGFEMSGLPTPDVNKMGPCEIDGTLGHSHGTAQHRAVTLKVHDYGYSGL